MLALDVSEPYTTKAKAYWKEAQVGDKVRQIYIANLFLFVYMVMLNFNGF